MEIAHRRIHKERIGGDQIVTLVVAQSRDVAGPAQQAKIGKDVVENPNERRRSVIHGNVRPIDTDIFGKNVVLDIDLVSRGLEPSTRRPKIIGKDVVDDIRLNSSDGRPASLVLTRILVQHIVAENSVPREKNVGDATDGGSSLVAVKHVPCDDPVSDEAEDEQTSAVFRLIRREDAARH
jgi:hypothetical protein